MTSALFNALPRMAAQVSPELQDLGIAPALQEWAENTHLTTCTPALTYQHSCGDAPSTLTAGASRGRLQF